MIYCILPPVSLPDVTLKHYIQLDPHNLLCLQACSLLLGCLASPRFSFFARPQPFVREGYKPGQAAGCMCGC